MTKLNSLSDWFLSRSYYLVKIRFLEILKNIEKSIKERSKNPESYEKYKINKKRNFSWYRIYIKNFVIFYTVESNTMKVAHIIYSRRDMENLI